MMTLLRERLRNALPEASPMLLNTYKLPALLAGLTVGVPLLLVLFWKWTIRSTSPTTMFLLVLPTAAVELGIWSLFRSLSTIVGDRIDALHPLLAHVHSWKGALVGAALSLVLTKSFFSWPWGILSILLHPSRSRWYHLTHALTFLMAGLGVWDGFVRLGTFNFIRSIRDRRREAAECAQGVVVNRTPSVEEQLSRYVQQINDPIQISDHVKKVFRRGWGGIIVVDCKTGRSLVVEFYGPGLCDGVHIEFAVTGTLQEAKAFARMGRNAKYEILILRQESAHGFIQMLQTNASINTNAVSGRRLYRGILP